MKFPLCSRIVFPSPEVVYRPRLDSPLHFDIGGPFRKFAWKNKIIALGIGFPHPHSSDAGLTHQDHVYITPDQLVRFYKKQI